MTTLPKQDWMSAPATRRVMQALEHARPGCARFVGGCVRNALLGEAVADIDIATQLTPDAVERVLRAEGCAVHPTGIEHGTLTIVADHQTFEVTTLRRDVETDGRRAVVAFTEDWSEDAQRRDFRINALYADMEGEVYDPTLGGLADISARRIIFVGDAETRIREDYLRILRFFRFHARYGQGAPDPEGLAACGRLAKGLETISAERIWAEIIKLLAAVNPRPALEAMRSSGVLTFILPAASDFDLLSSVLSVEADLGRDPDPLLRLLSLHGREEPAVADLARRMKVSNVERARLMTAVRSRLQVSSEMTGAALRRAAYEASPDLLSDLCVLSWAQNPAAGERYRNILDELAAWERPTLPVNGADAAAAGVPEGPEVGVVLRVLEAEWIASDFTLTRDVLLKRLNELTKPA